MGVCLVSRALAYGVEGLGIRLVFLSAAMSARLDNAKVAIVTLAFTAVVNPRP